MRRGVVDDGAVVARRVCPRAWHHTRALKLVPIVVIIAGRDKMWERILLRTCDDFRCRIRGTAVAVVVELVGTG